ncbi:hsp70 family chaperone [Colletotrichum asianum]
MWKQIERHLDYEPNASEVNCLVLTGGLSNNKYVQSFFKEKVQESSRTFGDVVTAEKSELAVSKGLVFDALESINRGGLFRYETRYFYGIAAYDSNGKVEVTKFLDKGKVVDIKDFSRKEDVKFELVDGSIADLKLQWMWSSKTKTARVKLSCERRTLTVTITDGNGTKHPLVFNKEWHVGTAVRPRPKSKRKRLKQYADAAEKFSWLAGLLIFFIPFGDEDEATEAQGGEEATDQYVEVTDQYAEDEESGGLDY